MRRFLSVALAVSLVVLLAGAAFAQMRGPMAGMMGGPGMGYMMGPRMMGGWVGQGGEYGPGHCPMFSGQQTAAATAITEEKAKELAQQYADQHLKGFAVERVLPFTGRRGTMYSVELKGPEGQVRTFHVSPWGNVMPFGGAGRRAG